MRRHPKTTFTVSITPFESDGTLSTGQLRSHFRRLAAADMGVYVVGSGSSEAHTLSEEEIETVLAIAVEELKGVVPVRAMGCEPHVASDMVTFAKRAASAGVDAIQIYSIDMGHGVRPSVAELERYYRTVIDAVEIPVVLATHESAGYTVGLDLLSRLAETYPNVIGVNCTHPDLDFLVRVVDELDPRLEIHVGGTQQAFACMALGGTGFMTGEGNLAPRLCRSVTALYEVGDFAGAANAFAQVCRLYAAGNGSFGSIRGVKAALAALGLPGGPCRPPTLPLSEEEMPALERLLRVVEGIPAHDL